jgi:hypothetical protein
VPAIRANPGGLLQLDEIYGRDELIAHLWRTLEQQSVRLEAEKRIGKSSVLRKMALQPPPGWTTVPLGLLNIHSAEEFAEAIYHALVPHQARMKRLLGRVGDFFKSVGGVEVGGLFKLPEGQAPPKNYWKTLLQTTIEGVVEAKGNEKIVFIFDEITLMLQNIARRQKEETAMEVLDVLSHLRKDYTTGQGFRMVLTGSIGMPHVLASLKDKGHADQGVSAMLLCEVPPLKEEHARQLARDLIEGEKLAAKDRDESARVIALEAGNIPFYIHWIVRALEQKGRPAEPPVINDTVTELLAEPLDPLELSHFRTRIDRYYRHAPLAVLAILDHVAANQPVPFADLPEKVRARAKDFAGDIDELVRDLLRLLLIDHYLIRDGAKKYSFRYPLLRKWWRLNRDV